MDHADFDARLRYTVNRHFVERGHAPDVAALAARLDADAGAVQASLRRLHASHGLVLHPGRDAIWVAHPFSTAPTGFWVTSARGAWWGNCAWCSLGIAALLGEEAQIHTRLGGEEEAITVSVEDGQIDAQDLIVHVLLPASQWWDNVIFTCSTMLFFRDESAVEAWCLRHGYARGATVPAPTMWRLAQTWYADYLSPSWRRRPPAEAQQVFTDLGLTDDFWQLDPDWK